MVFVEFKQQGNQCYKRKQYENAIQQYMKALEKSPFNVAVLTNIAQCLLRSEFLDDSVEFSTRALFVDPDHVKALSRRAAVWHIQKKWQQAAQDMERAVLLDPENEDLVEQHSIIAGDYEDSMVQHRLDSRLARAKRSSSLNDSTDAEELSDVEELRFMVDLLERMDETAAADSQARQEDSMQQQKVARSAWVAYELLLPFLERNEHARALFRTSHELSKLCERLTALFRTENHAKAFTDDKDREVIVNAMVRCATAAMANTPRNQIVMYRHASFRQQMLAVLEALAPTGAPSGSMELLPWSTQASILRLFEEAVESKSWRKTIMTSKAILKNLLGLLQLLPPGGHRDAQTRLDTMSKQNLMRSASSICLAISGDDHGTREFVQQSATCIEAIANALDRYKKLDARTLTNVLGFLANLSTAQGFRACLEEETGSCARSRVRLAESLLSIAAEFATSSNGKDSSCILIAERALAALLNLSFRADSHIRRELMAFRVVTRMERILEAMTPEKFSSMLLICSRAISLLCRLHAVLNAAGAERKSSRDDGKVIYSPECVESEDKLKDRKLLDLLYRVCQQTWTANANSTVGWDAIPHETWQLCAQIWCHVGWCVHEPHVREYLRDRRAIHAMLQTILFAYGQSASDSPGGGDARERVVGNIAKVLITMWQSDQDPQDMELLGKKTNLKALVDALQALPDGLARKNVAILLAKLCQADSNVKDQVRALRGIEMMLRVSQSLKNAHGEPARASSKLRAAGAAF